MSRRARTCSVAACSLILLTAATQACNRHAAPSGATQSDVSPAIAAEITKQEDLAKRLEELGDRAHEANDVEARRTAYESAKDIRVRLMAAKPNDTAALDAAATIYLKLGEALMNAAGQSITPPAPDAYDASIETIRAAIEIRKQLSAAEPHHLGRLRDLADSYSSLVLPSMNNHLSSALDACRSALDIRKILAEAGPSEAELLTALRDEYDTYAFLLADSAETTASPAERESWTRQSREAYAAALETAHQLTKIDSNYRLAVAESYGRLGNAWRAEGNLGAARAAYESALALDKQLFPGDEELRETLVTHQGDFASVLRQTGDLAAAVKAYESLVAAQEQMLRAKPNELPVARRLARSYEELSDARADAGQKAMARKSLEASYALAERLAAAGEDVSERMDSLRKKLSLLASQSPK